MRKAQTSRLFLYILLNLCIGSVNNTTNCNQLVGLINLEFYLNPPGYKNKFANRIILLNK